jgi:hypothetical protein
MGGAQASLALDEKPNACLTAAITSALIENFLRRRSCYLLHDRSQGREI